MMRVLPPTITAASLSMFDTTVLHTAVTKLGLPSPTPNEALLQLRLPLRSGGLGLRSMAPLAPAAFLASVAQSTGDINAMATRTTVAVSTIPTALRAAECYDGLARDGVVFEALQLPNTAHGFWETTASSLPRELKHLQRGFTRFLEGAKVTAWARRLTAFDRCRQHSLCGPHASAWLTALPTEPALTMSDAAFGAATRLRLGLPPMDDLPARCACGKQLSSDANHFLGCELLRSRSMNTRHNRVRDTVGRLALEAGASVTKELQLDGVRPDLEFTWSSHVAHADVSIVHPQSPSYVHVAAARVQGAACSRESEKVRKFAPHAHREGATFVPLILESFGTFGREFVGWVKYAGDQSQQATGDTRDASCSDFVQRAIRTIAVQLQTGNARVLWEGAQSARVTRSIRYHPVYARARS